ncbi:hypothetical protein Taro_023739 [Colocasia esculenta]|uniref:Uncharacterized protein n=1 Tax=Colocasia esculenta TaxID=4460 RepID=A0A843UY90_COLES|nr:hypothetical protein [Colocasia esculenta]
MWCVPLCLHGLWFGIPSEASARSREADSDQVRYRFNGLGREIFGMADRRDWGGGGDDPEESTQRMIERIWESLTDIRTRMDQQAPVPLVAVPPGDVPVAPVPPRVEMRFMALSRYAPYVVSDNNMMVEYFIRGLRVELQDAIVPLMCKTVEEAAQRAATLERSIRTRQVGESSLGSFRLP